MKLTNNEIYSYAIALNEAFADNTQRLPMKVNFYLHCHFLFLQKS